MLMLILFTILIMYICSRSLLAAVLLMLIPLSVFVIFFYAVWNYPLLFWLGIIIVVVISALAITVLDFK